MTLQLQGDILWQNAALVSVPNLCQWCPLQSALSQSEVVSKPILHYLSAAASVLAPSSTPSPPYTQNLVIITARLEHCGDSLGVTHSKSKTIIAKIT